MTTEKIDQHYHLQLSALMDGDLAPDQARFLLRRLQHDAELTACWERWQLCGDALRGQAQAPAPAGFAERIAAAVALEPAPAPVRSEGKRRLARWGGGALAASVAAVALFMGRQSLPEQPLVPAGALATQSPPPVAPAPVPLPEPNPAVEAIAAAAAAAGAVASVPLRPAASRAGAGSATRTRQAARASAATRAPERALASGGGVPVIHAIASAPETRASNPFGDVRVDAPAARPWPRAVLPQYAPASGYNAGFVSGNETGPAPSAYYPFEPRLPEVPPVRLPQTSAAPAD